MREHPAVGDEKQAKIKLARMEIKRKMDEFMKLQLQKKRFADGNMSRTAFNNLEVFSDIIGVSVGLLHRFNVIRIALALCEKKGCYFHIHNTLFEIFIFYPKIQL